MLRNTRIICVVAAWLALAPLTGATALAPASGLPGTGDRSFSPGHHAADNRYRVQDIVKVDSVGEFTPFWFPQPYPIAQFLAKLPPLPPGQHTYRTELQMSALSCDGIGTDMSFNCVGPGTIHLCGPLPFTVAERKAARPT